MKSALTVRQKLEIIQKTLGLTQTKMAERFGVSFAALNGWWTGKSLPRSGHQAAIDELFLDVIGEKVVPEDMLAAKKRMLRRTSASHRHVLKEITDHPDIRDEFILKLTYHSNRMEGSTLSEPDTAAILFDHAVLPDKSLLEHMEAKNHQTALNELFRHLGARGAIDVPFVLKLHGMLMNGIRPDAGSYRRHAVRIAGVHLATANEASIPRLMAAVLDEAAKATKDVIRLSSRVHSRFEQIHPFSDGNGRIGRLLMNAMFLKANLAPAIIKQERKRLYYTYLYKAQTKGDQSQLEDFLCDAVMGGFEILERGEKGGR